MSKLLTTIILFLFVSIWVYQSETMATPTCQRLFNSEKSGALFIHEKDSQLHTSQMVERVVTKYKAATGTTLQKPVDKLTEWLNYLTKISNKAQSSANTLNQLNVIFQKQYVIKPSEIPESHYALQVRLAKERGHGDIILSKSDKNKLAKTIIQDQKKSLESWTEYLVSKDTNMYPMWMKYWMFTGMTKLSKYDAVTGTFGNRDKSTVAPFPELNREALSIVVDAVLNHLNKQNLEQVADPEFQKLIAGMNFGKIYGKVLFSLGFGAKGSFKTNSGAWVVYPRGSDHLPLVNSIKTHMTGWCTRGEATAIDHLSTGDIHIYYSLDEKRIPSIPRVAIRMEGDKIAEVRGVGKDQHLDPQINQSTVVPTQMKKLGAAGAEFEKQDRDMKMLTQIDLKHQTGQALSLEELRFLYEIDSKISGFGLMSDPRVENIISKRDARADYAAIFENKYTRDEISLTLEEALLGKAKIHIGDLSIESATNLKLPEIMNGDLYLSTATTVSGLRLPRKMNGNIYIDIRTSAVGIEFPEILNGSLYLGSLTSAKGLKLPRIINGSLELTDLRSALDLNFPEFVNGDLTLSNLKTTGKLKLPHTVNGNLDLSALVSAEGLILSNKINGNLYLNELTSGKGLKLPHTVNGNLSLEKLQSASMLKLPEGVKRYFGPAGIQK